MTISPAATVRSAWHPWRMLALAAGAQAAVSVFLIAPALLIATWHSKNHLSLAHAGLIATLPNVGLVVALIPWGAAADRWGERRVLVVGLAATSVVSLSTTLVHSFDTLGALLFVGGLSAASANAASGRVVVGWFNAQRRGLAMGIRQIAQPVGVFVAALSVPSLAEHVSVRWALIVPTSSVVLMTMTVSTFLVNPPRRGDAVVPSSRNPYRTSSFLWRIHATSALLVVPQFTLSVFGLVWLKDDQHWSTSAAATLVGSSQLIGSAGRIGIGILSDRLASRVRPLRWVAVAACVSMVLLAVIDHAGFGVAAVVFVIATTISVADNGLGFTAVAEVAGPKWAGRALGAQNTGQFAAAALVGPSMGALITTVGYPWTFVVAGTFAALAVTFVPRRDPR